jgi:hypothetical protein
LAKLLFVPTGRSEWFLLHATGNISDTTNQNVCLWHRPLRCAANPGATLISISALHACHCAMQEASASPLPQCHSQARPLRGSAQSLPRTNDGHYAATSPPVRGQDDVHRAVPAFCGATRSVNLSMRLHPRNVRPPQIVASWRPRVQGRPPESWIGPFMTTATASNPSVLAPVNSGFTAPSALPSMRAEP